MIEYIIWGIAPNGEYEIPLYTKCVNMVQAVKVKGILEKDHGCIKCRVQVMNLSDAPDFAATITV